MLASCTKEVVKIVDIPKETEKGTVSIRLSLLSNIQTRSGWDYDAYFPSAVPTEQESKVSNVLLVIFKNITLEEYAMYEDEGVNGDFTVDTNTNTITLHKAEPGEHEIDLEPGVHYFYAVLNIPRGLYQVIQPQLEKGKYTLTKETFEKQLMDVNFEYLKGESTGNNGFIMTNSNPPVATTVYSDIQCEELGKTNEISISVGRALAKVSLAYVPAKTGELHGSLKEITYKVVNHPSRMHLMPVVEDGKLITPHYNRTNIDSDYFIYPVKDVLTSTAPWLNATTEKTENGDFEYCIENNVYEHLKSNTTGLVIRGQFIPVEWLNADGTIGIASSDGTFFRIAQVDNDGYLLAYAKGYYNSSPTQICQDMGSDFVIREYPQGICYYTYWPKNNNQHQVKRNDFHKIVITHIHGAGSPDIDDIINPDVDPEPEPTWGRLVVYAMGWDDYPRIEDIGETPEGDSDKDLGVSVPGWEENEDQDETLETGDDKNVFK